MHVLLLLALLAQGTSGQGTVGDVAFANSGAPEAQEPFLRGLALLHNFEYADAADAFRQAQTVDPSFAMAYWGEAMTYTHPIWFQQDLEAARAALARLGTTAEERLAKAKTERERDYLRTLDVLYGEGTKNERDFLYADAIAALHAKYPDDVDAAAFHALALLGTAHEGRDFATYMRSAAILEEVFPANPRHPGVLHYLIHSYDDPLHAPLGLRAARTYGSVAPNAPHALHMTSHIFVALGMWDEVIAANLRAIAVTNSARITRSQPLLDCGHYPIWLHYGYLQKGRTAEARKALDACRASAFAEPFVPGGPVDTKRGRLVSYAEMRAHHVATGNALTAIDAVTLREGPETLDARYTIAWADAHDAARRGDAVALRSAAATIRGLHGTIVASMAGDTNPAQRTRADVMLQQADALLLIAEGKREQALKILEKAAAAESSLAFEFGPPMIPKPSSEMLGEQLMLAGRPAEALAAYRSTLVRTPGRTITMRQLILAEEAAGKVKRPETKHEVHVH